MFVAQVDFDETGTGDGRHGAWRSSATTGGKFAILSASPDAANQNAWIAAFEEVLGEPEVRLEHRARRHRVRQRRVGGVLQPGARARRPVPRHEADHGADDGRHRGRGQGDAGRGPVRARSRSPASGCPTRCARTPRTAAPRSSRCGASSTSATSRTTPPTASRPGEIEAEEGATFNAGRMGDVHDREGPDPRRRPADPDGAVHRLRRIQRGLTTFTSRRGTRHSRVPRSRSGTR